MSQENRFQALLRTSGSTSAAVSTGQAVQGRKRRKVKRRKYKIADPSTPEQIRELFPHLQNVPLAQRFDVDRVIDQGVKEAVWKTCGFDRKQHLRFHPLTAWGRTHHKNALITAYHESLKLLAKEQDDYRKFFLKCLEANTRLRITPEFEPSLDLLRVDKQWLNYVHHRQVVPLMSERSIACPRPRNKLQAENLSDDLCQAWDELRELLWREAYRFTEKLRHELYRLAGHGSLGAIEWGFETPRSCRATYFSTVARCEPGPMNGGTGYFGVEIVDCFAAHSVHLSNAVSRPLGAKRRYFFKVYPERIARVLKAVPSTLQRQLRIVYGTRLQSLTVEREMRRRAERRESHEVAYDPLLIWDDLVLCGWDNEETRAEEADPRFPDFPYLVR